MGAAKKTTASGQKRPLGVTAYERICQKIITLDYKPGQALDEKQLMAELGLGRTPIREALLRLAGERWVQSQPNRAAIVPPITLQGTKAVFEAMKILEVGAVSLIVGQTTSALLANMAEANEEMKEALETADNLRLVEANHAFHMYFARCSQNDYLIRALAEVRNQAKRLSYLSYAHDIEPERSLKIHYASVVQEHEEIINNLKDKNEARLKEIIVQHINTFQRRIVRYMAA